MLSLSDDNFGDIIKSNRVILVDFWAEWCGPCKRMLPILQEISDEGTILIGKLNVDEQPITPTKFTVSSIPTMVLFEDGIPVHTMVGAMPKHKLLKEIEPWI